MLLKNYHKLELYLEKKIELWILTYYALFFILFIIHYLVLVDNFKSCILKFILNNWILLRELSFFFNFFFFIIIYQ
jgi:hypothetical protein